MTRLFHLVEVLTPAWHALLLNFTAADEAPTDLNTVVFGLVAKCERLRDVKKGETDPKKIWSGTEGKHRRTSVASR